MKLRQFLCTLRTYHGFSNRFYLSSDYEGWQSSLNKFFGMRNSVCYEACLSVCNVIY